MEAHFSGGDITKISVAQGSGLTGGGDNGEVTIGLDPKYSLPQNCTAPSNVAKFNGTAWVCASDSDTQYSNGTGLDLSGTQFSVDSDYRVKNTPDCAAGQFATGFESDGDIRVLGAFDRRTGGLADDSRPDHKLGTSIELPKDEGVDLLVMPLPAGTFLMTAVATVGDRDGTARGDEEVAVDCRLRNNAFASLPLKESFVEIGEESADDGPAGTAVIHGASSSQTRSLSGSPASAAWEIARPIRRRTSR